MKKPNKIAIIGCGGITCAIASHLALDHDLVLVDGDKFEAGNSGRQFPALREDSLDCNKAEYLTGVIRNSFPNRSIEPIPTYLEGKSILNNPLFQDVDFIFCAVDNNQSRLLVCEVADAKFIPAILMGNEKDSADAHLFIPGRYHPFEHHNFGPMTKAPFACTSDDNPAAEQTSRANFMAAAAGIHIFASYLRCDDWPYMTVQSSLDVRGDSSRTRFADYGEPTRPLIES